jgi:chromosome condensin MukBEF complex kleisin-like MukF subunit
MPDERHGDNANIVTEDLKRASAANGQDLSTTVGNLRRSLDTLQAGKASMGASNTSGRPAGSRA